jgi:protein O-GlcNAc transferase
LSGANGLFARAIALEDGGRPDEALACYREILRQAPQHADAWHNHGLLLARLGRLGEAERSHRDYARLHPAAWRAHSNLADVLLALERYDEALSEAATAAGLNTAAYLPRFTAGLACAMLQRFAEAADWFQRAQRADPAGFERFVHARWAAGTLDRELDPRAIYLIRAFDRLARCDWSGRDDYVRAFEALVGEGVAAPPLALRSLLLPLPLAARRGLADGIASAFVAATKALHEAPRKARQAGKALRIGYVSPDFRSHPTGVLCVPLLRHHNHGRFEVHAFSLSADDASPWRREVEKHADRFHSLVGTSLHQALAAIRAADVDVLVDLAGATTGAVPELFAARAAPVQVGYLGYPGSTGAGLVDYLLCDAVTVPEAEAGGYGEALARLPRTFWTCEADGKPGAARPRREDCGLPRDAVVLYAHHPGRKIYPEIFDAWMQVLRRAPHAVLWLLDDEPGMRANLTREALARGIAAERLVFAGRVPYDEYRARIGLADLALDTPIYNGGATTLDALAAGVPLLSCPAPGFAGRMTASALQAAGLAELVTADLDAYVNAAVRIATDASLRARLGDQTRAARTSALFDAPRRTREIEAAFEHMHARAARGEPPRSFQVVLP